MVVTNSLDGLLGQLPPLEAFQPAIEQRERAETHKDVAGLLLDLKQSQKFFRPLMRNRATALLHYAISAGLIAMGAILLTTRLSPFETEVSGHCEPLPSCF